MAWNVEIDGCDLPEEMPISFQLSDSLVPNDSHQNKHTDVLLGRVVIGDNLAESDVEQLTFGDECRDNKFSPGG